MLAGLAALSVAGAGLFTLASTTGPRIRTPPRARGARMRRGVCAIGPRTGPRRVPHPPTPDRTRAAARAGVRVAARGESST